MLRTNTQNSLKLALFFAFVTMNLYVPPITCGQEFVQPRVGRRSGQVKALNQSICDAVANLMKSFPDLLHGIADVQSMSISCIDDAIQGEKNGFLAGMSKDDLERLNQTLLSCQQDIVRTAKKLKGVRRLASKAQ